MVTWSNTTVRLPLRSRRPALVTELTTPRIAEPAGTITRSPSRTSTIVVASKRSSTCALPEFSGVWRRTSNSVPTGTSLDDGVLVVGGGEALLDGGGGAVVEGAA